MKDMFQSMGIGFGFGILFSIFARVSGFPIEPFLLWVIPFFSGILSALGALVASTGVKIFRRWGIREETLLNILGFAAAGVINVFIVLILMAVFGMAPFHRNVTIALFMGLAFGGVYAVYAYRINQMEERMAFLQALADKNRQLQEAARTIAITSERNRMSRELHDSVSQGLHGIMYSLHSLRNECQGLNPRVHRILDHLEATTQATQEELRTMIEELKPSLLAEKGLVQALRDLLDLHAQRRQIPVEGDLQLPENLPAESELALYRIAQEALANCEKHANAGRIEACLYEKEKQVVMEISDDGCGFDPERVTLGNGLTNLKRRAEDAGGLLVIDSRLGKGTRIRVSLPLEK